MKISYRPATANDLNALNRVIASAVLNWPMVHRVKRLAVPVLQYDAVDLEHFQVFVAERGREVIGVAALDLEHEADEALLHGLYVLPIIRHQGVGRELMELAFDTAREHGLNTVGIRAERVAAGYFVNSGLDTVDVEKSSDYPHKFVKALTSLAA